MDRDNKNKQNSINNNEAVAIVYDRDKKTPTVVAKGSGYIAEKILEIAAGENIPVHTDPGLTKALSSLNLGDTIPPELYEIVAQVYIFIDKVDKIVGENKLK